MQRLHAIGMVAERSRSGRPHKATLRDDRLIVRYTRWNRFATSARNRDKLNFGSHVSVRIVGRRRALWKWSRGNLRWNIGFIYWLIDVVCELLKNWNIGNETIGQTKVWILLRPVDGRIRVWLYYKGIQEAGGALHISMPCHVPWYKPIRAHMGHYWS